MRKVTSLFSRLALKFLGNPYIPTQDDLRNVKRLVREHRALSQKSAAMEGMLIKSPYYVQQTDINHIEPGWYYQYDRVYDDAPVIAGPFSSFNKAKEDMDQ